jgi:hypothetical protein
VPTVKTTEGDAEIRALVEALRPVRITRDGAYTRIDRYRDFHRVLHGTEEGKRVLSQIIDLCEGPVVTANELDNHALLAARAWGRRISTMILSYASVPPSEE